MKIFKKIAAVSALFGVIISLVSCSLQQTPNDNAETDTAEPVNTEKSTEFSVKFEYDVDSETKVSLTIEGNDGFAEKIKVQSTGHAQSSIDLTSISERVLETSVGVEFESVEKNIVTKDINLDGCPDLLISAWSDDDYNPYYVFLWNTDASFVYSCILGDPYIDVEAHKVYSTVYSDGVEAVYVYDINEMELELVNTWSPREVGELYTDISNYEDYIEPIDGEDYLILVNDDNMLEADYYPEDLYYLVDTREDNRPTQQMRTSAAMAVEALFAEMRASGYNDMSITSAFRDYDYQEYLFNSYVDGEINANGLSYEDAVKAVSLYSAEPGTSEHQTGLCCDMHNLPEADRSFENEPVYEWLKENAWKFGFVLRYPENKQNITKITFEPWHYRFVGRYNADKMTSLGLCLEEYCAYIAGTATE